MFIISLSAIICKTGTFSAQWYVIVVLVNEIWFISPSLILPNKLEEHIGLADANNIVC